VWAGVRVLMVLLMVYTASCSTESQMADNDATCYLSPPECARPQGQPRLPVPTALRLGFVGANLTDQDGGDGNVDKFDDVTDAAHDSEPDGDRAADLKVLWTSHNTVAWA